MKRILLAAAMLAATIAHAQTTIVATHIAADPTGALLSAGEFCVTPVVNGHVSGFQAAGNTQVLPQQACVPISSGSIGSGISVADTATAAPAGVGYQVQIQDYRGIPLYSLPQLIYPTGSTWSLDTWVPTSVTPASAIAVSTSNTAPTGDCGTAAAIRYIPNAPTGATSITEYGCILHSWVINPGGGGGGGSFTGGTLTSALYLSENPLTNTEAATKVYVDNGDALATQKSANLSDLANAGTARTNLGLGTAAQQNAATFSFGGSGYQSWTFVVGTGGVTVNKIVTFDATAKAIAPTTAVYGGIAAATVSAGGNVEIIREGIATCVFDGASTVGDIVVPSSTNFGDCHDSGFTTIQNTPSTSPVVGVVQIGTASLGQTGAVRLHGPGNFGAQIAASSLAGSALPAGITSAPGLTSAAGGAFGTAAFANTAAFDAAGAATTAQTAAEAAFTGDVTKSSGAFATTVTQVNGAQPPAISAALATNSSRQLVSATGHQLQSLLVCADTSASGTAQTCNTSVSFTPAANDCIIYTTTTANSGTGLTLNVNSLGAKSVAKWLGSTTLAVGDVAANSPQLACYTGTVWNLSTIGNAPSGGSGGGGTVTSVGMTVPSWLTVTGTPITGAGTLAVAPTTGQTSHQVLGTCGSATTFGPCALVAADIPALSYDAAGAATTAQANAEAAFTGDVTKSANSFATTVGKINGGTVPTSATLLATNSSAQPVAATPHAVSSILSCADTSASGTAQSCTTSPSFTPAANDCVIYTTSTANTGTGLTLNVNAQGAKSVAKYLGTTTLAPGDVPANQPQMACFTGTTWNVSSVGNAPATFTNVMTTLGDLTYGGASGALTRLAGPTSGSTAYTLCSTPSGGSATAPAWCLPGIGGRTVTGTTDTIAATDRGQTVLYTSTSSVAVTLPSAATLANNFDFVATAQTGSGTITLTAGAGAFLNSSGGSSTTQTLTAGQTCAISSPDNTNYLARCSGSGGATGTASPLISAPAYQGETVLGVGNAAITTTGFPTNYVGWVAPVSGTPAYLLQLPSATPSGAQLLSCATPSTVNGVSQSVCSWTASGSGFANPMTTAGDIIYGGASGAATRLAGNTAATDQVLISHGTGSVAASPTFGNAPALSAANMTSFPTLNQSTTGSAAQVNGVSYPASPSTHTYPVITASNTASYASSIRTVGWSFGDVATGSTLTTSEVGYVTVPFACTITGWHIMADAGTVTIKTARVNGGTALPTISNSISTSGVALSTGTKVDSTTVTDFTSTSIAANDTLGFFITSVATAKQITFQLDCAQ